MFGFSRSSWARLFRDGSWVLAGQVATVTAGLIGIRILTELAPPAVFGETALWLGVLTLSRNFFVIPISMFQVRYYPDYKQQGRLVEFHDRLKHYLHQGSLVMMGVGTVAYFGWVLAAGEPVRPTLLVALLIMSRVDAYRTLYQNDLNAERRQQGLAIWTAVESWAVVVVSAAALSLASTAEYYLIGTGSAWILTLILFRPSNETAPTPQPAASDWPNTFRRKVIRYGLPFMPLAVFSWILHFGNRYILGLHGTELVGVFSAAFGLANKPATMASSLVATVVRPILFNAEATGRHPTARRVFLLWLAATTVLGTCICSFLIVLGPWIVRLFLAPEYRVGAPAVIVWIGIGYSVYALVNVVENRIMSYERSGMLIVPVAFGAGLVLLLNLILTPLYGSLGTAWATAGGFVGQLVATVLSLYWMRTADGLALPEADDSVGVTAIA